MSSRSPSRILLIVDDLATCQALSDFLAASPEMAQPTAAPSEFGGEEPLWTLEVESVSQGSEGVSKVRQAVWDHRPYDLVILDLPEPTAEHGPQTLRQLVQIDAELAILVVKRGQTRADLARQRYAARRLVFIPEHVDQAELRQLVAAQLDRRQGHEELRRVRRELDATRRALERMREEAEEAEQVKRQLLANISHEVRTPMNAILGFTRLVMKGPLAAEQLERLRYVQDAGNALMRLIEGVLDFSKLSAGKLHLDRSAFHLETAIRAVLDGVKSNVADKGLSLVCQIEPSTPLRLRGDAGRFREVLASLVDNAVKFTENGTIQIRVSADEDGDAAATLRVVVTDTGIGIPLERQAKVFRSFSQGDGSATREFGGVGLGLALSKRLLELMGGQIGFRSTPGQGSTFWFTVPFEKDQTPGSENADARAAEIRLSPEPASRRRGKRAAEKPLVQVRILVAEDDRLDRLLLEALLSRTGALVDLVSNGREALNTLKNNTYDLAFMDVEMPEVDGLTAIHRIRQAEAGTANHLKIVALTANSGPGDREKCLAAGADEYISKPFSAEALLGALERWLPGLLESSRHKDAAEVDVADSATGSPTLADCVSSLRRALSLPDFRELDAQAQTVKRLAAGSGASAVADYAMRVQLAARRGDLDRASAAVDGLDRAVGRFPGGVRRKAVRVPVSSG